MSEVNEGDPLEELISRLGDGEFVDYLLDSDAAEELVRWIQEESGIKSRALIRLFVKQLVKVVIRRGRVFAQGAGEVIAERAREILHGIKGFQTIARALLKVLDRLTAKQLDARLLDDIIAGRRPARDVLEAEALGREFSAQMSVLADIDELTRELADAVRQQGSKQPNLDLPLFPVTDATRMHFASRSIPFLGREAESEALRNFLADEADFRWWVMTGPAGQGKSRLALEFCLRHGNAWRMGFLPSEFGVVDWRTWQPEEPTFMAIDFAAARSEEAGQIVRSFYFRKEPLAAPVRILLLERQIDPDGWWKRYAGARGTSERLALELTQFAEPLGLQPMTAAQLERVMVNLSPRFAGRSPDERTQAVERLGGIDQLGRPLFAAIAADAIESGRDLRAWDTERLLADLIGRERDRIWSQLGVSDEDENLLALATLANGVPLRAVDNPRGMLVLPKPQKGLKARYEAMTGKVLKDIFLPLEPDIVGEYFVLDRFGDDDPFAATEIGPLWEAAYHWNDPLTFIERAVQDFPDHPTTAKLAAQCFESIDLSTETDDWRLQVWFMRWADIPPAAARAGHFELAASLIRLCGDWARRNATVLNPVFGKPYPLGIWYGGSAALTAAAFTANGLVSAGFDLAHHRVELLRDIVSDDETNARFEILVLEALLDRAHELTESQMSWVKSRLDRMNLTAFRYETELDQAAHAMLRVIDYLGFEVGAEWLRWRDKLRDVTPDYLSNPRQATLRLQLLERELDYLRSREANAKELFEAVCKGIELSPVGEGVAEAVANLLANELCHHSNAYGAVLGLSLLQALRDVLGACNPDIHDPLVAVAMSGLAGCLYAESDFQGVIEAAADVAEPDGPLSSEKARVHYAIVQQILVRAYRQVNDEDAALARLSILDDLVGRFPDEPHLTTIRDQLLVEMISERHAAGDILAAVRVYVDRYPSITVSIVPEEGEKRFWQMRAASIVGELLSLAGDFEQALLVLDYLDRVRQRVAEIHCDELFAVMRQAIAHNAMRQHHHDAVLHALQSWLADDTDSGDAATAGAWLILGIQLLDIALSQQLQDKAQTTAALIEPLLGHDEIVEAALAQVADESREAFAELVAAARGMHSA